MWPISPASSKLSAIQPAPADDAAADAVLDQDNKTVLVLLFEPYTIGFGDCNRIGVVL